MTSKQLPAGTFYTTDVNDVARRHRSFDAALADLATRASTVAAQARYSECPWLGDIYASVRDESSPVGIKLVATNGCLALAKLVDGEAVVVDRREQAIR